LTVALLNPSLLAAPRGAVGTYLGAAISVIGVSAERVR
jgi:hypothetical protein